VERIQQAELTVERFSVPRDFSLDERVRHAWGISDEDVVHVRLRFHDGLAAQRAQESQWHPSQDAETNPDGTTELTFDVNGLLEITPWILSWGSSIEAIEPPELRQRIADAARASAARYNATG
jgi:predicted DNA-binding transcriptional regulator YafY